MSEKNFVPKISVIIPMYNSEKYIGSCLQSILGQTFQDFEIIVVDDCSTDKSCEIVENYIKNFEKKIKLVRMKKNSGGPGFPSNQGLNHAKGKYVFFMDNDDLILNEMLGNLYELGEKFQAEVVYMDKGFMFDDNPEKIIPQLSELSLRGWQQGKVVEKPELETEDLHERVKKFCRTEFGWPAWEKLVRRDLLIKNKIIFPEINSSADVAWSMQIYFCAKKILRVPRPFYCYRQNPVSILHKNKTVEEKVNFWMTINSEGLYFLEKFLSRQDFFQKNLQYKWNLLEFFDRVNFESIKEIFSNLPYTELFKVNEIIKPSFEKIFGDYGKTFSYIFTQMNNLRAKHILSVNHMSKIEENLSVRTRYGTFNGFFDKNGVKTWLGIPYAQPPTKNLRWQAPKKLNPTDKIFDAKNFGSAAVQFADDYKNQSEDCLTLNIWKKSEKNNLPVMVWIHGGAFAGGCSSESIYNGSNFAAENEIILVTINYRLNVFGFMNFSEIDKNFSDSGYLGIKDQIAALEWIKENISEFGGNPENITIFGESAGSISCMFLSIIPAAKKFFQKAIPQSGSLNFYNIPEDSAKVAEKFIEKSGVKNFGDLMKKSADELKNIYLEITDELPTKITEFLPTCDGKFLPENPLQALKNGAARGIKILTGNVADEWRLLLRSDENFCEKYRTNTKDFSSIISKYKTKNVEEIYKNWLKNRTDNEENFIDFANNLDWKVGQEISAEYQSNFEDVYFYLFTQQPSPTLENLRAFHGLDLPYTFNVPYIESNPNQNLVKIIQASWAAFAKNGNPNNEFIPNWEKYSAENRQTMELNSKKCILHKDLNTENLNELRYIYEN